MSVVLKVIVFICDNMKDIIIKNHEDEFGIIRFHKGKALDLAVKNGFLQFKKGTDLIISDKEVCINDHVINVHLNQKDYIKEEVDVLEIYFWLNGENLDHNDYITRDGKIIKDGNFKIQCDKAKYLIKKG